MAAYMRNKFPFLGIKSPQREKAVKALLPDFRTAPAAVQIKIVRELYALAAREYHYAALDLLKWHTKKLEPLLFLPLVEELIQRKTWWDSVDVLSPKIAGQLFLRHPQYIAAFTERWLQNDNFWLQRAALIFQLNYRQQMNVERLTHYVLYLQKSEEFFVQKGAGWALRSASRYFPVEIAAFLATHGSSLPKLTLREGRKLLDKAKP